LGMLHVCFVLHPPYMVMAIFSRNPDGIKGREYVPPDDNDPPVFSRPTSRKVNYGCGERLT
jgi:hypothetical protein